MTAPRDLVCEVCWDGLFNTRAYQDLFTTPMSEAFAPGREPPKVVQRTTSKYVRDNCPFVMTRNGPGYLERVPKSKGSDVGTNDKTNCTWCEYVGTYSFELDEDGNAPGDKEDLLEITLEAREADCSTPLSARGPGAKEFSLLAERKDRKTGNRLVATFNSLHGYTTASDPAAEAVISRPVRNDVGSQEATDQITLWIRECESRQCGEDGRFYKQKDLPTRVIDVGLDGSRNPRVVETRSSPGVYATLSYCWGGDQKTTLRRDNMARLQSEIDFGSLSRTIRDAVTATRRMGIPFLWVDALCIVQDDEVDKATETAHMHDVYSRSAVTIVASSASGADQGFLSPPPEDAWITSAWRKGVLVPVRLGPGRFGTMRLVNLSLVSYNERSEPLARRAWAVQEQLLAQRKLEFNLSNRTMTWSCPHAPLTRAFGGSMHLPPRAVYPESKVDGYLYEVSDLAALARDPTALAAANPVTASASDRDAALRSWLRLVAVYSRRSATLQADKLNALAGIAAHRYAPLLGPGYFAGLWEYGLLRQLAWTTSVRHRMLPLRDHGATVTRPLLDGGGGLSRAPSWSWASVEGDQIEYVMVPRVVVQDKDGSTLDDEEEEEEGMSEVVSVAATPKYGTHNPLGEIQPGSGRLTLRTRLRRAWWHASTGSLLRTPCAPSAPSSSSDESSDESSDDEARSVVKPPLTEASAARGGEEEKKSEARNPESCGNQGAEGAEQQERVDGSPSDGSPSASKTARRRRRHDVVVHGPALQHLIISRPPDYVSPFKRVLRRAGPMPPDSDPEYDTPSEIESGHEKREHTWWGRVSASLDEKRARDRQYYSTEAKSQREYDIEHVDLTVVYMLPLAATARRKMPRHKRHRPRDELVQGLLLVKDAEAMERVRTLPEKTGQSSADKQHQHVLFKRVGEFRYCPKSEFEGLPVRDVTIV